MSADPKNSTDPVSTNAALTQPVPTEAAQTTPAVPDPVPTNAVPISAASSDAISTNPARTSARRKDLELPGRTVVIGMLSFGIFMVSLLFTYFELHTRPFRPLREAIGREFKHSRPNVEGGQLKGRGPKILRISMCVSFDPFVEEHEAVLRTRRVLQIAGKYQSLASYEQIQINLIDFVPEGEPKRRTFDWPGSKAAEIASEP